MNRGNLSRRGFLQQSLGAMAAAGLPLWYAREALAFEEASAAAQTEKAGLVMGAIGIGSPQSRGRGIMNEAVRHKARYVAVCDVDSKHLDRAAEDVARAQKGSVSEVTKFKDYRELLARKDIDAVTIATPDHWHAIIALAALKAGKDVYCEKPLTLTIDEGKVLVKAARQAERVFQVGSQQRSDRRFRLACELVRNGRIGKIQTVETRIGANPTSGPLPVVAVPDGFDYDFWLGPTPKAAYCATSPDRRGGQTRCHYEFRWWYEYSGGKMTDWGAHHNDIAQWGLGMDGSGPVAVEGSGTEPSKDPNAYNTHKEFKAVYTYANGAQVVCTSGGENGIKFIGEGGQWIFVSRGKINASDPKLLEEPLPKDRTELYVSDDHMGNFMDCVKSRKRPICDVEIGHRSVTVCHLGNIAIRTGKKVTWDPAKEVIVGDSELASWQSRPYRAPWKLEG